MPIQELVERFMMIDIMDDLNESVQTIAERIAKDYILSVGRPSYGKSQPNYCVKGGLMASCAAAVETKAQYRCYYYIKHSYEPKCRYCSGCIDGHCDNAGAQRDKRDQIAVSVTYTDEEIRQAWEEVVYHKRIRKAEGKEAEISL